MYRWLPLIIAGCGPAQPPFQQGAFVWQRNWDEALQTAIQQKPADLAELLVLAGEVEWSPGPQFQQSEADFSWLAAQKTPIGLAIRVGYSAHPADLGLAEATAQAVRTVRARSEAASLVPVELHLDIDMPTTKLADYARWLPTIREAWPGMPLTITGLPDWLRPGSGLEGVLSAVDGWVLQLHWLRKTGDGYTLIDENESRQAVISAAQRRHPFRVALPTYQQHGVRAPAALLVSLVNDWQKNPPSQMQGILWFRLPLSTERDTLPLPAWNAIRAGRLPTERLRVTATENGLAWDLKIQNDGEDETGYSCVLVHWSGGLPEAVDVFGKAETSAGLLRLRRKMALRPGETQAIGWIRLRRGERINEAEVVDNSRCADLLEPADGSDGDMGLRP